MRILTAITPLLLLVPVLGCTKADDTAPWSSIRLLDRLEDAVLDTGWNPSSPVATGRAALKRTRLGDLPRATSARSDGRWAMPFLLGRPAATDVPVSMRVVQVIWRKPIPAQVRVTTPSAPGPDDAWFATRLKTPLRPRDLKNRARLEPLLKASRDVLRLDGGVGNSLTAVGPTEPQQSAWLIVALGSDAAVDDAHLEVTELSYVAAWFDATESAGSSRWSRRAEVDGIFRESLVMATPGSARFRVRVPAEDATFSTWVADPLHNPEMGSLTFEVTVTAGDERRAASTPVEGPVWAPLRLDLAPFAGRDVELTLSAEGRAGTFGLFGQPEVRGAPRDELPLDVVVISLDTVRADRTSLHGGRAGTTPTLERLAESSAVFDAAIAVAPWTLPSHLSMFSGFYPDRHGVTKALGRLGGDVPWFVEELRDAGYRTLAYAASGYVNPQFGFARGFERYGTRDPVNPPLEWAKLRPDFEGRPLIERARGAAEQRAELLAMLAEERDRPLFLFLHSYQAHDYHAPPDVLRAFGAAPEEMEELLDGVYFKGSPFLGKEPLDEVDEALLRRRSELLYDAALSLADAFVDDVVRALEKAGRLDRTILVILSDHGEELFDHGGFGHGGVVYEELIRVPFLIRVPGKSPRRIADVVSHVDLAPTVRSLLGLTRADDASWQTDGRDLAPLLDGQSLEARPALARGGGRSGNDSILRALRGRRLKLIETRNAAGTGPRAELYDLVSDPREEQNLASKSEAERDNLVRRLERHVATLRALAATSVDAAPSTELLQALEELGYLGDD